MAGSKKTPKEKSTAKKQISDIKILMIFIFPLTLILAYFPYKDPVFLNNPYPFNASYSGSSVIINMGFSRVPENIPAFSKPPPLSLIGIPDALFEYKQCVYHNSYFEIDNKKIYSDAVSLDVRVKLDDQTNHLIPNSSICFGNDVSQTVIFVGDASTDNSKALELLKLNGDKAIAGQSQVLLKQEPVHNKLLILLGMIFTFYPLYWASIIALKTVSGYVYKT